jgi:hypothetical protein
VQNYGLLHEFWTFLFEQLNKVLKSYKTSNHAGGELKTSFFRGFHHTVQEAQLVHSNHASHPNTRIDYYHYISLLQVGRKQLVLHCEKLQMLCILPQPMTGALFKLSHKTLIMNVNMVCKHCPLVFFWVHLQNVLEGISFKLST